MTEAARKLQNEYMKKWRRNNKEKVKAAQKRYWEKQARNKINSDDQKEIYG